MNEAPEFETKPLTTTVRPSLAPELGVAWHALEREARGGLASIEALLASRQASLWQVEGAGLTLDFSHQRLSQEGLGKLVELARERNLAGVRDAMFRGQPINATERRAALHVALRAPLDHEAPWGQAISQEVAHERERFLTFAQRLRDAAVAGAHGMPLRAVVNLGIGGSDLGPRMVASALARRNEPMVVRFVSNPDPCCLEDALEGLEPATTLFIIQSKTFTTQETTTLAHSARQWLARGGVNEVSRHFAAVTARPDLAQAQGLIEEHVFRIWDWVGGRYSICSAIGLPAAVAIGRDRFEGLLSGAFAMDRHFVETPLERNLPVLAALTTAWNRNFLGSPTQVLLPYAARLALFVPFVQQLDMESLGKRARLDGQWCQTDTGAIIWGGLGIDGQHAYFQLLHQGTHRPCVEFIGIRNHGSALEGADEHHRVVQLNLLAQAKALALGRDENATRQSLLAQGLSADEVESQIRHRTYAGNVPSSTLWLERVDAPSLGALIALYEHKVLCLSALWGINAFDQWGVELGKQMAKTLESNRKTDDSTGRQ